MIRAWRRRPARRAPVDETVFFGAQLDVRDAQIEGLRDALADSHRQLVDERRRNAVLVGQLATYKAREYREHALRLRRQLAEDKTAEVTPEQLARSRPMDAPTEQYDRRPR